MTSDPLEDLRRQVAQTREAAERIAGDAVHAAREAAAGRVPPQGWASPDDRDSTVREIQALAELIGSLRDLVPEDLYEQLRDLVRQLLLVVRALIDLWVDRIEQGPRPGGEVAPRPEPQDIPIG